ncbi:MAG: formate dehydrogenase accessory protein FdhE [Deltaproteobacteria bacterium]|nr:formate dehydrogenase accessory protein FdhE [Deltaproteobacteria bacterium]
MSEDPDYTYKKLHSRVRELQDKSSDYSEVLVFYQKVLTAQQEFQEKISVAKITLSSEQTEMRLQEGFTLLDRQHFPIDEERSRQLFLKLCTICQDENPVLAKAAGSLQSAVQEGSLNYAALVKAILTDKPEKLDAVSSELDVTPGIVMSLTKLSIQPSIVQVVAELSSTAELAQWRQNYCPICGGLPAMAALVEEEGKRLALCSFCGFIWRIPRIGCPFCQTEEQEKLRYFFAEGQDQYRVQVCDKCGGYLKILDTRQEGSSETLAVEDLVTAHLDLLAEQEGYTRKAPLIWGI